MKFKHRYEWANESHADPGSSDHYTSPSIDNLIGTQITELVSAFNDGCLGAPCRTVEVRLIDSEGDTHSTIIDYDECDACNGPCLQSDPAVSENDPSEFVVQTVDTAQTPWAYADAFTNTFGAVAAVADVVAPARKLHVSGFSGDGDIDQDFAVCTAKDRAIVAQLDTAGTDRVTVEGDENGKPWLYAYTLPVEPKPARRFHVVGLSTGHLWDRDVDGDEYDQAIALLLDLATDSGSVSVGEVVYTWAV